MAHESNGDEPEFQGESQGEFDHVVYRNILNETACCIETGNSLLAREYLGGMENMFPAEVARVKEDALEMYGIEFPQVDSGQYSLPF